MIYHGPICFITTSAWAAEVSEAVTPAAAATVGDAWNQLLSTVILAVLGLLSSTILPYAVILARSWFKAKIAKIQNDELRAAADFAMLRVDRIVQNVVREIQQTRPTREPLSKEQAKALLSKAYGMVKAQVTDDIMEIVKTVVKDPNRYIVTKIEASVNETKLAKATAECK